MKVRLAHCVAIGPNRCGLYGTARDLVKAERKCGIDAGIIDAKFVEHNTPFIAGRMPPRLTDPELKDETYEWGEKADIYIRHSFIPVEWQNVNKPLILALHGRPESSFRLEQARLQAIVSTVYKRGIDPRYKAIWSFWPEHIPVLKTIIPIEKLFYVPAPVDLDLYCPEGEAFQLKDEHKGSPNILIADIWREDIIPFNIIFAALQFKRKYCSTAKIHISGLQGKNLKIMSYHLKGIKDEGALGRIWGITPEIIKLYRMADIVITPHTIATRTVREPLACGVPVVAGSGNKYTPYKANPRDIDGFADAINECWQDYKSDKVSVKAMARQTAEIAFNLKNTGKAIRKCLKEII